MDHLPNDTFSGRVKRGLTFASRFLSQGTQIASFCPSSRSMTRSMLHGIQWEKMKCIVELGAGTGPVTEELIARGQQTVRRIIIEKDPELFAILKKRFPREELVLGDAVDVPQILKDRGIGPHEVDHVLSGLPCPSIPKDILDRIMQGIRDCLVAGGSMRQLTMFPFSLYANIYNRYFHDVRFKLQLINVPPGGVYICMSPKHEKQSSTE